MRVAVFKTAEEMLSPDNAYLMNAIHLPYAVICGTTIYLVVLERENKNESITRR